MSDSVLKLEELVSRLPGGRWVRVREFSPGETIQHKQRVQGKIKVDDEGNVDTSALGDDVDFEVETLRVFVRAYSTSDKSPTYEDISKQTGLTGAALDGLVRDNDRLLPVLKDLGLLWYEVKEGINSWAGDGRTFYDVFPHGIDRSVLIASWRAMHYPTKAQIERFMKVSAIPFVKSPT